MQRKRWNTHIVSECSKLTQTIKWYTHKPEVVLKNASHKIPLDFEIQSNHLIRDRRLIKKKRIKKQTKTKWKKRTCCPEDFAIPVDHRVKIKESEKIARELKTTWNMWVTIIFLILLENPLVFKRMWEGSMNTFLEVGYVFALSYKNS